MFYFDEDEIACPNCGHVGVVPDGDFDYLYPKCGCSFSFGKTSEN